MLYGNYLHNLSVYWFLWHVEVVSTPYNFYRIVLNIYFAFPVKLIKLTLEEVDPYNMSKNGY